MRSISLHLKNSKYLIPSVLLFLCLASLLLHLYKAGDLCLNEDEAAQGYNTYSVLQTGKDEYGKLPIRYLSFGENKLPLTGLLSAPFIYFIGLSDISVRLPVYIIGTIFPLLFYFATYSLTKNKSVALCAAFFSTSNFWLQATSRHQHEAVVLSAIVLLYITILFSRKTLTKKYFTILSSLTFLGFYTYHSAKIIIPSLTVFTVLYVFAKEKLAISENLKSALLVAAILSIGIVMFASTEFLVPNNRLGNLSYFTHPVFIHEIEEGRRLGGSPLFYNKAVYGTYKLATRSLGYLSPQYLLINSDPNPRYGSSYLPLLSIVEYILFLVGIIISCVQIYYKRSLSTNLFLHYFIIISILPASLALPVGSSTRSYLLLIPTIILTSQAVIHISNHVKRLVSNKYFAYLFVFVVLAVHTCLAATTWGKYFNEYLSNPKTSIAWQCGMKQVAKYAWENYGEYDKINIASTMGQPYIFLLFYGGPYPPSEYQKVSKVMPYNTYGFWEQETFDRFTFAKSAICDPEGRTLNITNNKALLGAININLQKLSHGFYAFSCK